jgi:hypothetical protein
MGPEVEELTNGLGGIGDQGGDRCAGERGGGLAGELGRGVVGGGKSAVGGEEERRLGEGVNDLCEGRVFHRRNGKAGRAAWGNSPSVPGACGELRSG